MELNNITIPRELLLTILQNFDRFELIYLCRTNKSWYTLCKNDLLWQNLAASDYGLRVNTHGSWYNTYRTFTQRFNSLVVELLTYYSPHHPRKIQIRPFNYQGEVKKWTKEEAEQLIRSHLINVFKTLSTSNYSSFIQQTSTYIAFFLNNLSQSSEIYKLVFNFIVENFSPSRS